MRRWGRLSSFNGFSSFMIGVPVCVTVLTSGTGGFAAVGVTVWVVIEVTGSDGSLSHVAKRRGGVERGEIWSQLGEAMDRWEGKS